MISRLCVFLCLIVAIIVSLSLRIFSSWGTQAMSLLAVEYEVYGKVQGVFFRKFTNEKAQRKGMVQPFVARIIILSKLGMRSERGLLVWAFIFYQFLWDEIRLTPLIQFRLERMGEEHEVVLITYKENVEDRDVSISLCRDGTVRGEIEGDSSAVRSMMSWLQNTGSPMSRIDRAVFSNERNIREYSFDCFKIVRWNIFSCNSEQFVSQSVTYGIVGGFLTLVIKI